MVCYNLEINNTPLTIEEHLQIPEEEEQEQIFIDSLIEFFQNEYEDSSFYIIEIYQ